MQKSEFCFKDCATHVVNPTDAGCLSMERSVTCHADRSRLLSGPVRDCATVRLTPTVQCENVDSEQATLRTWVISTPYQGQARIIVISSKNWR